MALSIQGILGNSLGDVIKNIIAEFRVTPDVKAQLEAQLAEKQLDIAQQEMDINAKLNDIAGQNIRAEQESGDKYVTRARPSWAWGGLCVVAWNYCVMPCLQAAHVGAGPVNLPDAFWWTVGTVVTGYVFNRTAQDIMQMPGDSSIKLGPLQLGQKSTPQG